MVIEETVTIPKSHYKELVEDSHILNALRLFGVDNWEWYGEALDNVERPRGGLNG